MEIGQILIAWSIRLALSFFAAALLARLWLGPRSGKRPLLAGLWTAGFWLFLIHVVTAYHYQYKWSHFAAVTETAQQTKEQIGFAFGGGIYFNFLFLLCWGIEVIWNWYPPRPRTGGVIWLRTCGIAYMLFIAFNGTVVFKSGWIRILGLVVTAVLLSLGTAIWLRRKPTRAHTNAS